MTQTFSIYPSHFQPPGTVYYLLSDFYNTDLVRNSLETIWDTV